MGKPVDTTLFTGERRIFTVNKISKGILLYGSYLEVCGSHI